MNAPSFIAIRALLQSGLTTRDVAELLRVDERAIAPLAVRTAWNSPAPTETAFFNHHQTENSL